LADAEQAKYIPLFNKKTGRRKAVDYDNHPTNSKKRRHGVFVRIDARRGSLEIRTAQRQTSAGEENQKRKLGIFKKL